MEQQPTDIGSRLRHAREQQGVALQDIANATKISMVVLKAIERNDFGQLPGGIFTRSYLRAFAHEVGVNPDEIASEYRTQFETPSPPVPSPLRDVDRHAHDSPLHRLAVLVFSVGFLISGWWLWPPAKTPPASSAVDPVSTNVGLDDVENVTLAIASSSSASDEPTLQLASDEPTLQLEIRPIGMCWVSATTDGQLAIYRLMKPGEHAMVDARETIVLRLGDAEACAYSINGAPGRQLGEAGVAVTVHIAADNYQDFLADPASSVPEVRAIQSSTARWAPVL